MNAKEPRGPEWAFDGHGRLFDLGKPPHIATHPAPALIRWLHVTDVANPLGHRAAVSGRDSILYDQRIASHVYEHLGGLWVNLCHEPVWWDWIDMNPRPDRIPRAVPTRACHVWIELREQRHPNQEKGARDE